MLSDRLSEVFNNRALSSKALGLRYDEVYLCSSVHIFERSLFSSDFLKLRTVRSLPSKSSTFPLVRSTDRDKLECEVQWISKNIAQEIQSRYRFHSKIDPT